MGLCKSEQAALAEVQAQEQLVSNEIPQIDISQRVAPFLLNVPELLYPQETPIQEAPKQETSKQVYCLSHLAKCMYVCHIFLTKMVFICL